MPLTMNFSKRINSLKYIGYQYRGNDALGRSFMRSTVKLQCDLIVEHQDVVHVSLYVF